VVITGDLAENGDAPAYLALRHALEALKPRVGLTLGNHDDRAVFAAQFPECIDAAGFAQHAIDMPDGRVIVLDTLVQGQAGGRLGPERLDWLDQRLTEAGGRPSYLFMHHPPADIGMPVLDRIKLVDSSAFFDVLQRHGNVVQVFAGHAHRIVFGMHRGVPFSVLRSTNHQTDLDFDRVRTASTHEAPLYAVILAQGGEVVMHTRDFTDTTRFHA